MLSTPSQDFSSYPFLHSQEICFSSHLPENIDKFLLRGGQENCIHWQARFISNETCPILAENAKIEGDQIEPTKSDSLGIILVITEQHDTFAIL